MTTIDQVIKWTCMDMGLNQEGSDYVRMLGWAQRGMAQMRFESLEGDVKETYLTLTDYNSAPLPQGFVDWVQLGWLVCEEVITFVNNKRLPMLKRADDCGDLSPLACPQGSGDGWNSANILVGQWGWNQDAWQGLPAATGLPTIRIDQERNEVVFSNRIRNNAHPIYMSYVTDGSDVTPDTILTPYAQEALVAWIRWKYEESRRSSSSNEKYRLYEYWIIQKRKAMSLIQSYSPEDMARRIGRATYGVKAN